ncbi:MAG: hypothetical protein L6Q33_04545 [Bacteriovoracaceae bacterium]|jgi:predicted AAA+ superfamily ATPase|nr:hypothetical protein [Bacteriovoracaceae bacterium]
MSCSTSCGCGSNKIILDANQIEAQIIEAVSKLNKGDEIILSCENDFSQELITVMNSKFQNSKVKAFILEKNANETLIQLKYPETEESCCGFCS